MKKFSIVIVALLTVCSLIFSQCKESTSAKSVPGGTSAEINFGGYPTQALWGKHLTIISGCNDCHTPKKMSPMGPVQDASLELSGHPAKMPAPNVNEKEMQSKGLAVTNDLTVWVGPWGTTYAANLTPDDTGLKNWTEAQFIKAMREGKYKGLDGSRQLLPPMPWENFAQMSDGELKAIFAYLKTLKPIHNVVPDAKIAKHG